MGLKSQPQTKASQGVGPDLGHEIKTKPYITGFEISVVPFCPKSGKQESRYHHIYANGGYQAGILNHFEEDFVEKAEEQIEGYIKAGDIVLFDPRIQHSIKYANNGEHRDNIMLYFSNLRTNRNRFLGWIDEYHLSLYST